MSTYPAHCVQPGRLVRILSTGQVVRVLAVDADWERLFPHRGPLVRLAVTGGRTCYAACEVEPVTLPGRRPRP